MSLYFIIVLSFYFTFSTCGQTSKNCGSKLPADYPLKDVDYEVRPNLFIDKDNLLGKSRQRGHQKGGFTYTPGPYGPSRWNKLYPKCAGKHQSPINIDIPTLKHVALAKLRFNDVYQQVPAKITASNTHNTLCLHATYENGQLPAIQGGPLHGVYQLVEIHFHWSSSDHRGSEHTINKKTYPMEMHVIHSRNDSNYTAAMSSEKGLAVLGYIFEVGDKCNDAITNILQIIDQVRLEVDTAIELNNLFRLDTLIDRFEKEYVTYEGSLTTPPCYETVTWIVSPYLITISKKQIERFRQLSGAAGSFGDNYRTVQALNGRVVNFVDQGI